MPIDASKARAAAAAKKDEARQRIESAKLEAAKQKALKQNPPKQYVTMPEQSGDAEKDSAADLSALQAGFRERAKDDASRKALATDSEFWGAICFQTREQRDAFFGAIGATKFGLGGRYFDGVEVAKLLGIKIPTASMKYNIGSKPDPAWVELTEK